MAKTSGVSDEALMDQVKAFRAFFYFHGYQPPRKLVVEGKTLYDITGEFEMPGGYNERIWRRCYFPMTYPLQQWGVENPQPILSHPLVEAHLFGPTRDWIRRHHPKNYEALVEMTRDMPIPVVDSYLHVILPLVPDKVQELLVDIGLRCWEQDMGKRLVSPGGEVLQGFGFWPAELGINHNTVEILSRKGVRFLILNIDQLEVDDFSPIYRVETKTAPVYVLAYNGKEFAQKIAFGDVKNAGAFADKARAFAKKHGFPPFAAMDMETFGEWRGVSSFWFLNYFVHQAMNADEMYRDPILTTPAKIRDATSWSCVHGLGRWTGKNKCGCDGVNDETRAEKLRLYEGLWNQLDKTLGDLEKTPEWEGKFVNFFVNMRERIGLGEDISLEFVNEGYRENFKRLLINLVGFTSCGWFYAGNLERQIPETTLEYLEQG